MTLKVKNTKKGHLITKQVLKLQAENVSKIAGVLVTKDIVAQGGIQ